MSLTLGKDYEGVQKFMENNVPAMNMLLAHISKLYSGKYNYPQLQQLLGPSRREYNKLWTSNFM